MLIMPWRTTDTAEVIVGNSDESEKNKRNDGDNCYTHKFVEKIYIFYVFNQ